MNIHEPSPKTETLSREALKGVKVLVVDDNADMRFLMTSILKQHGADIRTSDFVERAITEIVDFRPDVIVSDISMPGKTGFDLVHTLRHEIEKQGVPKTPAIAVSAISDLYSKQQSLKEGFQAHLQKPLDRQKFVNLVCLLANLRSEAVEGEFYFET